MHESTRVCVASWELGMCLSFEGRGAGVGLWRQPEVGQFPAGVVGDGETREDPNAKLELETRENITNIACWNLHKGWFISLKREGMRKTR